MLKISQSVHLAKQAKKNDDCTVLYSATWQLTVQAYDHITDMARYSGRFNVLTRCTD
jgi:hypothetical protein